MHQGLAVTANHLQYMSRWMTFPRYLDTSVCPSSSQSLGMDFATVGVAHVNLAWVLDDVQTGHDASAPVHFCDVARRVVRCASRCAR